MNTHEMREGYALPDLTTLKFKGDGLYRVYHIIIPTVDWLQEYVDTFGCCLDKRYDSIYVTDYRDFYIYDDGLLIPVGIDEFISGPLHNSSAIIQDMFTFTYDHLKECLVKRSEKILSKVCSTKCPEKDNDDYYIRDVLWMAINVLQYLLDQGSYFEALHFLNTIKGCGNVCPEETKKCGNHVPSCGCKK